MSHRTTIVAGKTNHIDKDLMTLIGDMLDGNSGVVGTNDYKVTENSPVGMSVLVASGSILTYIPSQSSYYRHRLTDASTALTIDSNSSGSTRIDIICHKTDLTQTPDADGGGIASLVVVKGTPGAGVPSTPANHVKLAEVTVANGAASIANANITDSRVYIGLNANIVDALNDLFTLKPHRGFLINGKISVTVAGGNLTAAIKTQAGNDPSADEPVYVKIGDVLRSITSALSVTKNAGTNWCNSGGAELATKEVDYFVYLGYNATDGVVIGFSRIPYATEYDDFSTTATNEKYCAISTITNAAAGDDYEVIGRFAATLSAGAGYTWTVPTFTNKNLIQRPIYRTRKLTYAVTATAAIGSFTTITANGYYRVDVDRVEIEVNILITNKGTAASDINLSLPFVVAKATAYSSAEIAIAGVALCAYSTTGLQGIVIVRPDHTTAIVDGYNNYVYGYFYI